MKTVFVAGTDTGVGKTVVAGALAAAVRSTGLRVGVLKPVSCGGLEDIHFLQRCAGSRDPLKFANPIALDLPLSPNVAARLGKKKVDLKKIDAALAYFRKNCDVLVVEGCGGLLVPVTDKVLFIDLVPKFKAATVLVSRSGLGAINHSLLSIEALRSRKIEPAGIIFNRTCGGPLSVPERTNPEAVAKAGRVRPLGVFPFMKLDCAANCLGKAFLKHIDLGKILC